MRSCPCMVDGWAGRECNVPIEMMCLNQCSGKGECRNGFCLCNDGYYGHDCARKGAGAPDDPGAAPSRARVEGAEPCTRLGRGSRLSRKVMRGDKLCLCRTGIMRCFLRND
jgi:hypothetical protein